MTANRIVEGNFLGKDKLAFVHAMFKVTAKHPRRNVRGREAEMWDRTEGNKLGLEERQKKIALHLKRCNLFQAYYNIWGIFPGCSVAVSALPPK